MLVHPPVIKFGLEVHHAESIPLQPRKGRDALAVERAPKLAVDPSRISRRGGEGANRSCPIGLRFDVASPMR
jgi:hypothetical protein